MDTSGDNVLQGSEVTSTQFVCNTSASWSVVTINTQAASNHSYIASSASRLKFTLPTTAQVGDTIALSGAGTGGWEVTANSGQTIISSTITSLAVPSADSQALYGAQYASIQLQYVGGGQFMPLSYNGGISNGFLSHAGLFWSPTNIGLPWGQANTYCSGTINGSTGWRLPTLAEVESLVTSGKQFTGGWNLNFTWTATGGGAGHWGVVLDGSNRYTFADTYPGNVTCVK